MCHPEPVEGRLKLLALIAGIVLLASAGSAQQTGTFALLGGKPSIVSKFWATQGSGSAYTLNVQQFAPGSEVPIKQYDVDMQHFMHMVIVRDDFATFEHDHPSLNATTGTFTQNFTKGSNHRYYVYADTDPKNLGQQVFRFTMESDGAVTASKPSLAASSYNAKAGPYNVLLQKTTLPAQAPQTLDLTVVSDDDPASDLVPYLGAPAHVVMIDTSTLSYAHVHPTLKGQKMAMHGGSMETPAGSSQAGPFMQLTLPALPAGVYKTWVQIAGGAAKKVYTASYTVVVK
jgi:hypothetical protein